MNFNAFGNILANAGCGAHYELFLKQTHILDGGNSLKATKYPRWTSFQVDCYHPSSQTLSHWGKAAFHHLKWNVSHSLSYLQALRYRRFRRNYVIVPLSQFQALLSSSPWLAFVPRLARVSYAGWHHHEQVIRDITKEHSNSRHVKENCIVRNSHYSISLLRLLGEKQIILWASPPSWWHHISCKGDEFQKREGTIHNLKSH